VSKLTAEWCEKEADGFAAIALDVAPEDGGGVEFVMHAKALRIAALALRYCAEQEVAMARMDAIETVDGIFMADDVLNEACDKRDAAHVALLSACREVS
jgi:hypothetical protein